jgi:hypothetical protein
MPVPTTLASLSTTPASNSPGGNENPFPELDDHIRQGYAFDAQNRDAIAQKLNASAVSAFGLTLVDDADAAAARTTLGAVGLTGAETIAGVKTFASSPVLPGNAANALEAVPLQQVQSLIGGRNRVINGTFSVNQRQFAGGALTAGSYGHDRWKAGAGGGTYTVTGEVATITAGTLQQVIEGVNVPEGGAYTLSWTGTAQARVDGGAYAASPITVTGKTAASNTTVEFGTGTVSLVQYEAGGKATPFERRLLTAEQLLCYRYTQVLVYTLSPTPGAGYSVEMVGNACLHVFPVEMRASPSWSVISGSWVTAAPTGSDVSKQRIRIYAAGNGFLQGTPGAPAIIFNSEL